MSSKPAPRFDPSRLREIAGDKVFARGEAYQRGGQVDILSIEPDRIIARVEGTRTYRVTLTGKGKSFDADCTCPAFEDWGPCKHFVATALAVNLADGTGGGSVGVMTRIEAYLKGRPAADLAAMILKAAERDDALFRELDIASAMADADDDAIETRLRSALEDAIDTGGYVEYRDAYDWANGVGAALDALESLASGERAALALKLAEFAIDRVEEAIGEMDDSDGHGGALLNRLGDIHLAACRAVGPDPLELAHDLFEREMDETYDTFFDAVERYADVLGEDGLDEYRRLATGAWKKLPPAGQQTYDGDRFRLTRMMDFFAERDGDVEARIAIRKDDLSSPYKYLELAEFCLAQGREDEALHYAEEGLWVFEDDRVDERLVAFAAERLCAAGRDGDSVEHLWRAFRKAPTLDLYRRLRKIDDGMRDRALAFLEERIGREPATRWYAPGDLLVEILTTEQMFDAAWAAIATHGASAPRREALAKASETTHPKEALEAYVRRVEECVASVSNHGYEEAAALIARMTKLHSQADHEAYVADLCVRHKRKRNFMKLLE